uniref:Uncharacterized protein n=1 Tax=Panagrolaimus superbus TaxID=310955 RepID=A0A914Y9U8_9BILA
MLFRFASLYGIGKNLGRIPYVNASIHLQVQGLTEISEYFPLLHEYVEVKIPHESLVTVANFSDVCCIYETPKNLEKYNNVKYLKLSANYLQSYKFFHHFQMDIKKLLECSNSFKQKADMIADKIWKTDKFSHKLCVHVRRGDFFYEPWPLETRMDFVNPALEHIYDRLKDGLINDISLLIIGNDKNFISNMSFPKLVNFIPIEKLICRKK